MTDALGDAMDRLVAECFPAIAAIHAEPWRVIPEPGMDQGYLHIAMSRAILSCRTLREATAAVTEDEALGPALQPSSPMYLLAATGAGGRLQAEVLPLKLVLSAVLEILLCGERLELATMQAGVAENLRRLRAGVAGEEFRAYIVFPFANLRLQSDATIETPWGELRAAHRLLADAFIDRAREVSTVLGMPIETRFVDEKSHRPNVESAQEYQRVASITSYSVTLGSDPTNPSSAIPLGWGGLSPLGLPGWGGEFRMPGRSIRDAPLSVTEINEIARWCGLLDDAPFGHVEVGLRRIVSALAERLNAADALTDAVIAWENLVEHRDQPTKSVLFGLQQLLAGTPAPFSKTRLNRLYEERSDVVHGEIVASADLLTASRDAISVGIYCFRSLFERHAELLNLSSEERCVRLGFSPAPPAHCPHCGEPIN